MNFFTEAQRKLDFWKIKYKERPCKAAFKLAKWCVFSMHKFDKTYNKIPSYSSWLRIEDSQHNDISYYYKKEIDKFKIPSIPKDGYILFDIQRALQLNKNIKTIGLVIFNGIGDYFLCTAFIEQLVKTYPNVNFDAYVPQNKDNNGSPLVYYCLKVNPYFRNVYKFEGKSDPIYWKNYDFSKCYENIDAKTLLIPLIYDFDSSVKSRYLSLCHNYCLIPSEIAPYPIVYTEYQTNEHVLKLKKTIDDKIHRNHLKGVVWLQLKSTCFKYTYAQAEALVSYLTNDGYFVVCVDENKIHNDFMITIDTSVFTINDSIKLLSLLKTEHKTLCLGVISCFTAISSALHIPNLVIQPCYDSCIESVWHPNCFIVTHVEYKCLPASRQFNDKTAIPIKDTFFVNFNAKNIFNFFNKMDSLISEGDNKCKKQM